MAERLTPEQLEQMRSIELYDGEFSKNSEIDKVWQQAIADARTLQRVRAWTESEPNDVCEVTCPSDEGNSSCHQEQAALDRQAVAALLRAE